MNQVSDSGNGVGGSDVPPPPRLEQIQHTVGLTAGVDPEMLRSITRDKIAEYIESLQYLASLRGLMPEIARQLEEILFKLHSCQRDYCNMMAGLFEPELQLAISLWSSRNRQNQLFSGQQITIFPIVGIEFPTPPIIRQDESGNPRMYSCVTNSTVLASSSVAGMVHPQSATMGTSLPGKDLDEKVYAVLSLGMKRRPKPKVTQAQEVLREPKFSYPICMNELVKASSTICGHIFCDKCIKASIRSQRKCPTCRRKLSMRGFHRLYLPTTG